MPEYLQVNDARCVKTFRFGGEVNVATAESHRIPYGVVWGSFGVLAWAAFSILTGGGSAHADDESVSPLGELAGVVSSTLDDTVAPVVEPVVVEVVAPVVQKVVAPVVKPVAQKVVSPVTQTVVAPVAKTVPVVDAIAPAVSDTATAVVAPVTDVLQESPLSQVTAPVFSAVAEVPVVGKVLDDLGVTTGVTAIVDAVDATTGLLGDALDDTVAPIVEGLDPTSRNPISALAPTPTVDGAPGDVPIDLDPSPAVVADEGIIPSRAGNALATDGLHFNAVHAATASADPGADATSVPTTPAMAAHAPPASTAPTSSAANGGGSMGDGAQFRSHQFDPLHSWTRMHEAPDDELPSSPVADADVSPD